MPFLSTADARAWSGPARLVLKRLVLKRWAAGSRWLGGLALALLGSCGGGAESGGVSSGAHLHATLERGPRRLDVRTLPVGRRIPDVALAGVEATDLAAAHAGSPLVVILRDPGDPECRRIAPELARIEEEFAPRGIGFLVVDPASNAPLARALGARTAADVFVLDRARTLVYRGAVDDRVGEEEPRFWFLRDALTAVLAGQDVVVEATEAGGRALSPWPAEELVFAPGEVTWHDQAQRIVQRRCGGCHRDGGAGPFPLETRNDVLRRDGMVEFVVEEGIMPPWLNADGTGPWHNDARLSDWERASLLAWLADGGPGGDPAHAPVPRSFARDWGIGEPDLVFTMVEAQHVPAEGDGSNRPIPCIGQIEEDVWVRSIELRPSVPEVVHHTIVMTQYPQDWEHIDRFTDKELVPWKSGINDWQFLIGYLPGTRPVEYPTGIARFLPKGTRFLLYTHYNPNGIEVMERSELGFVLADEPPTYVAKSKLVEERDLDIPPHAASVPYDLVVDFERDTVVTGVKPHMHYRGKSIRIDLHRPDGSVSNLVDIAQWDQDWQFTYDFLNEILVPAGSRITAHGVFDNSAANLANPDPSQHVTWGELTRDEMLMMMIDWLEPVADGTYEDLEGLW